MGRPRKTPNRINSLVDEHAHEAVAMTVRSRAKAAKTTQQQALRNLLEECFGLHPTLSPLINMLRIQREQEGAPCAIP